MVRTVRVVPALLLTLTLGAACNRNRAPATPAPQAQPAVDTAAERRAAEERQRLERERAERERQEQARLDRERAERERAARADEERRTIGERLFFNYDRSDLTAEARATLDTKLAYLRANPDIRIRIAGHADDRGSDEYNMALGQQRAAAAKRYLVQRGIDAARIEIISYGEEMPLAQGADEQSLAQNRRDEFEITAGGVMARTP